MSITPRQALHSLSAHHKDQFAKKAFDRDRTQIIESGYHCDCNNIVATSPFTEIAFTQPNDIYGCYAVYLERYSMPETACGQYCTTLRGPPSLT